MKRKDLTFFSMCILLVLHNVFGSSKILSVGLIANSILVIMEIIKDLKEYRNGRTEEA